MLCFSIQMFALSYVTKTTFDGISERLRRHNQTISDLKVQNAILEKETKEKDSKISSLESELYDERERNTQLAENNNLLLIREEAAEERHRTKLEEVVGKAKMAGALWLTPSRGIPRRHRVTSGSRLETMMTT